jgi:acyl-CoA thioesterase FadM
VSLILRLLYVLLSTVRRPRLGPLDESVVRLRVLPNDLDTNLHLNNGRYLTLMDLGRVDLLVRLGVVREMRRRRWGGVVASATVRFRRALNLFQRFDLHTRLLCWDDRWFYMEHRFVRRGETMAVAIVKARFVAADGRKLEPREVVAATRHPMDSPPMPPGVREWVEAEERIQSDVKRRTYEQVAG